MRIIVAAPYLYDVNHKEFVKNATGFGYMVKDIVNGISENNDVFFISHQITKGYRDKYTALRHTVFDIIRTMDLWGICQGIWYMISLKAPIRMRLRNCMYFLDRGYFKKQIKKINPDIVHIHGLTYQTRPYIEYCEKCGIPYVVTLHGLNGIDESVNALECDKKYERAALTMLTSKKRTVTVVSSGIKKMINIEYSISTDNIFVVLNGINYIPHKNYIEHSCYNIISVGNISTRKNQIQLVRAFELLPEEVKRKVFITFCGNNDNSTPLIERIRENEYSDHLNYVGYIEREQMQSLWEKMNLNVVVSKSEGFGLSIIEGFAYGVPTLLFDDLDVALDINCKDAIQIMHERTDQNVADGIINCMNRHWDRERIQSLGSKYSLKRTISAYEDIYQIVCRRN